MKLTTTKLSHPLSIDANWNKEQWNEIAPQQLNHFMGKEPVHRPKVEFKTAYDEQAIYLIFRVEDQYVRAIASQYHGPVYQDSCVEFFFTPNTELPQGYFNLEVNCGGTALFSYRKQVGAEKVMIPLEQFKKMTIAHSLPKIVDPEITTPTTWTVEYRLPYEVLEQHCRVNKPAAGVLWRANFYKCADKTSYPHWLTWAPVDFHKPKFHLPEFFGTLEFE